MNHTMCATGPIHVPRFFLGSPDRDEGITCVEMDLTDDFLGAVTAVTEGRRAGARDCFEEKIIAVRWYLDHTTRLPPRRTVLAGDGHSACLIQGLDEPARYLRASQRHGGEVQTTLYFHGGEEFLQEAQQARLRSFDIVESGCHTLFEGELAREQVTLEEFMLLRRSNCSDVDCFFPETSFVSFEEWVKFKQRVFALQVNAALLRAGHPSLRTDIF